MIPKVLIKYSIFVILIFIIHNNRSFSQSYFINNYSIENGLPSSMVLDATQDSKGRMWFATQSGISVYDGFAWENLESKMGLPKSGFRKLFTDEKGIIWCVPTYNCETMVYFLNDSMNTITLPEIRDTNNIKGNVTSFSMFYENNKPVLCIGTINGIYVYKDDAWENYKTENGLIDNYIYKISENKNKFYIVTRNGVSVFDGKSFDNSLNELFSGRKSKVISIVFEKDNNVNSEKKMWILAKNWIGWYGNNKLNIVNESFFLPDGIDFEYPSLVFSKDNIIFFGNFYYTYYINVNTGKLFTATHKQGFQSDGSTSMYLDREGNIWRTGTRGIDKLNNLYLVNYFAANGLQDDEVTSIYEYEPGKLLLGHNKGITFFSEGEISKISFPESSSGYTGDSRVLDICKDKEGSLWLACSSGGLARIDKNRNISWIKFDNEDYVNSVAVDDNGKVWISSNNGIYIVKDNKLVEQSDFKLEKHFYRRILFEKGNEVYITSPNGLIIKKGEEIKYYTAKNNDRANNVYSVLKNKNGKILIGTKDGLYYLKNDIIEKFSDKGFSINRAVYSIMLDKTGNYWFGTDDGVVKWDGNEKQQVFTKSNGLSGRETNRAALCNDIYGNVWIGTQSGLTCYRPEFNNNPVPVPVILILNAEDAEGNRYSITKDIKLKSNIKSLFFNFRGISFYNENYLQYKIKLDGFDADWYQVNQNYIDKIRYTNLVSGDYKLLIAAKNISGEWSEVYSSSVITIEVPYYQKWWFILISVFVITGLFYMFYKVYLNRIYYLKLENKVQLRTKELRETELELRNTQTLLEDKVKERTAKLGTANEQLKETNATKDKFFSIIAHDLKSPFVGLLGYSELLKNDIDSLSKEKITEYSENLNKNIKNTYNLLENLLNWALFQTGKMSFNPENIDLFLEINSILELFEANTVSKNITIVNDIKINTYVEADKNMIRTVLYNLISNAIKFTKPKGIVCIKSEEVNNKIIISVTDNGVGISKETQEMLFKLDSNISTKGTLNEKGTGLGLLLCKEMVDKHKGKIDVESEEGKGTTFMVSLPLSYN